MALAGSWTQTVLGPNIIRMTGRTFGAAADLATIGLFGDSAGDTGANLPASWVGTAGEGQAGTVPTNLQLQARTIVTVTPTTDPANGANSGSVFFVQKNTTPFEVVVNLGGHTSPTTPVGCDVYIQYVVGQDR